MFIPESRQEKNQGSPCRTCAGSWRVNHASLVVPRARFEALPAKTRTVLARIDLGFDGDTEIDWLVNVEKKNPREAARNWMQANESQVAGWLKNV